MNHFPTWTDLENMELAFFPIGSTEQHGFHLPTNTDSIIATAIAQQLAEKHKAFVVPTLPYSASFEHMGFPGCLSLRMATLSAIIEDILYSLEQSGVERCVIINGHGGNKLLANIAQEINHRQQIQVLVAPSRRHWEKAYQLAELSTSPHEDMHAGEGETSILLYLFQEQAVRMNQVINVESENRPLLEVLGMRAYTQTGTIGYPSRASRKKGKDLLDGLVEQIDQTVMEFLNV